VVQALNTINANAGAKRMVRDIHNFKGTVERLLKNLKNIQKLEQKSI
jgi:hypothetical protein